MSERGFRRWERAGKKWFTFFIEIDLPILIDTYCSIKTHSPTPHMSKFITIITSNFSSRRLSSSWVSLRTALHWDIKWEASNHRYWTSHWDLAIQMKVYVINSGRIEYVVHEVARSNSSEPNHDLSKLNYSIIFSRIHLFRLITLLNNNFFRLFRAMVETRIDYGNEWGLQRIK